MEERMTTDKCKQSLYFPVEMLEEIKSEAFRQDRSLSWIVQRAWGHARKEIQETPDLPDIEHEPTEEIEAPNA